MRVEFVGDAGADVAALPVEMVERKGIGHPDSLADLVAEAFSRSYSRWCLDRFGVICQHVVDKVMLVGAATASGFGHVEVHRPVRALLVGSVTTRVGVDRVPVEELFAEAVASVLTAATRSREIVRHVRCEVINTAWEPYDNLPGFFHPAPVAEVHAVLAAQRRANDTVYVTAHAPHSPLEQLVIDVENLLTAAESPPVGTDVKVLARRLERTVDLVACVPAVAEHTPDLDTYRNLVDGLRQRLARYVGERLEDLGVPARRVAVRLNTKDEGARVYLAPFGTSLGKGDVGVVGRGNRYAGTISSARPASAEAAAGKNPLHHAGKLYTIAAARIAEALHQRTGQPQHVTISASKGGALPRPDLVVAASPETPDPLLGGSRLVEGELDRVIDYADRLAHADPIHAFRTASGWLT
jgi:S-adenosylmethionine synthetase